METGIIIKNLIIIGIILGVVGASQSAHFRPVAQQLYSEGKRVQNPYITKADEWLKINIYPKLGAASGEVAKTQDSLQQEISEKKDNLVEQGTNQTKKLLAEKFLQFLGITPQDLGACEATN